MAFLSHTRSGCGPAPVRRASVLELIALRRQRRALARLDDDALADMGLSRKEAMDEAGRGFLDVPANWGK